VLTHRAVLFLASLPGSYHQPLTNTYLIIKGHVSQSSVIDVTKYYDVDHRLNRKERRYWRSQAILCRTPGPQIRGICEATRPTIWGHQIPPRLGMSHFPLWVLTKTLIHVLSLLEESLQESCNCYSRIDLSLSRVYWPTPEDVSVDHLNMPMIGPSLLREWDIDWRSPNWQTRCATELYHGVASQFAPVDKFVTVLAEWWARQQERAGEMESFPHDQEWVDQVGPGSANSDLDDEVSNDNWLCVLYY
jgi:hypothetical protein